MSNPDLVTIRLKKLARIVILSLISSRERIHPLGTMCIYLYIVLKVIYIKQKRLLCQNCGNASVCL